jgi:YgiT-type zinc finger domain-containing protein
MKCLICRNGETELGKATVTLERDSFTFVVKNVPAQVCSNCGEEYIDEDIVAELMQMAEEVFKAGTQVDIREYKAA